MKPLVRKFRWTDIELQRSREPVAFPTLLEIYVGYDDREGVDQFQIEVVTLRYLRGVLAQEHVMLGLHLALVDDFSAPAVEGYLRAQIEGLEADSWDQLVNKIGRMAMWESQDYGFSQSRRPKGVGAYISPGSSGSEGLLGVRWSKVPRTREGMKEHSHFLSSILPTSTAFGCDIRCKTGNYLA